ncbi:hypothetical protein EYF80_053408 [Liparis tanakae]|uniref:Uncharacterized protein n=1 Tax=Liparis tanakae TaxID=230148 RepID=A0A4Z2F6P0_9TELE|nr:hypothetical protein EYF80_053408 [Liparis tanakae]
MSGAGPLRATVTSFRLGSKGICHVLLPPVTWSVDSRWTLEDCTASSTHFRTYSESCPNLRLLLLNELQNFVGQLVVFGTGVCEDRTSLCSPSAGRRRSSGASDWLSSSDWNVSGSVVMVTGPISAEAQGQSCEETAASLRLLRLLRHTVLLAEVDGPSD